MRYDEFKQSCQIQSAARRHFNDAKWHAPYGVTLHFRRVSYLKGSSGVRHLTADIAKQNVRHFINVLNKWAFGKAYKYGRRIQLVSVVEGSINGVLHYHLQIECPIFELEPQFADLLKALWLKTDWGAEIYVECYVDPGWIDYITKLRTKACFADAIDWENTHLNSPGINPLLRPQSPNQPDGPASNRKAIVKYEYNTININPNRNRNRNNNERNNNEMTKLNYNRLKHVSNEKIEANPVPEKLKGQNTNYKRMPVYQYSKEEISEWVLQNPHRLNPHLASNNHIIHL